MFEQIWEFIMSLVTVVLSWFGIELGKHIVEEQKDSQSNQHPQVLPQVMPQDPQESNEAQLS
jgi:AMMECR1 domain-containing protein